MKWRIVLMVSLCLVLVAGMANAQDLKKEKAALSAAQKWLSLVDKGRYGESWQDAASYFKRVVSRPEWTQSMQAFREPLGKLVSRKVRSVTYRTSLPGAPDREYVVIEFDSAFTNKEAAIETVTPMLDTDRAWHVSGYFIK